MAVLDQIYHVLGPVCLTAFTGALIAFAIIEFSIFFYDRNQKKKERGKDEL